MGPNTSIFPRYMVICTALAFFSGDCVLISRGSFLFHPPLYLWEKNVTLNVWRGVIVGRRDGNPRFKHQSTIHDQQPYSSVAHQVEGSTIPGSLDFVYYEEHFEGSASMIALVSGPLGHVALLGTVRMGMK